MKRDLETQGPREEIGIVYIHSTWLREGKLIISRADHIHCCGYLIVNHATEAEFYEAEDEEHTTYILPMPTRDGWRACYQLARVLTLGLPVPVSIWNRAQEQSVEIIVPARPRWTLTLDNTAEQFTES